MSILAILIPISVGLGGIGLAAFLWSLRSGQYDDLDGAAERILLDDSDQPGDEPRDEPRDDHRNGPRGG